MPMKFSETRLKSIEVKKKTYLGDQELKHFFVRAMPTRVDASGKKKPGKKTYVVRFRPNGYKSRVVETAIGEVGKLSLDAARKKARLELGEIEAEGGHDLLFAMNEYLTWLGNQDKHQFDWQNTMKARDQKSAWAALPNGKVPLSRAPSDLSAKFYVFKQFFKFMKNRLGGRNPTLELVAPRHVIEFLSVPSEDFRQQGSNYRARETSRRSTPSPATKRRRLSAVSALYDYFKTKREIDPIADLGNPALGLTVSVPKWNPLAIDADHIATFKSILTTKPHIKDPKPNQISNRTFWIYRCFLHVRLLMGTRAEELILADWSETKGKRTNYLSHDLKILICWKHKNFHRTEKPDYIPVPSAARKVLLAMREEGYVSPDPENKAVFFDDRRKRGKEDFVGRISSRRANEVFKEVCEEVAQKLGEEVRHGMTQRNLRHTFVTSQIKNMVRLDLVSRAVRHKDLNTIKFYHEVSEAEAEKIADLLPEI